MMDKRRGPGNRKGQRDNFRDRRAEEEFNQLELWKPKTRLGKEVKEGKITDIADILAPGRKIMEAEIVDTLMPTLENDLVLSGQAKGKFGGGKRRIFRQTQKKTAEGNKPIFSVTAAVGNRNGYIGVGKGRSKETKPAREKAVRNAKLNLIQIARGCGSWECTCGGNHSIPFKIAGRSGSVRVELLPAPKGTGLVVENDLKKILGLAGIKDVWSKTYGQTSSRDNLTGACMKALKKSTKMHMKKVLSVARFGEINK